MFYLTKLNIFVLNYINFNSKIRYEQLNMISEKKLVTISHHQLYKRRMAKVHDRKVRPREFKKWDLVLRKILPLPGENILRRSIIAYQDGWRRLTYAYQFWFCKKVLYSMYKFSSN